MTAPFKPWEMSKELGRDGSPSGFHHSPGFVSGSLGGVRPPPSGVPPLPSRSSGVMSRRVDGSVGWRAGGGLGMYPPHHVSYLGGYGPPGYPSYPPHVVPSRRHEDFENRFIQMAEESSQPAFQSIEAFVRSFSSVTLMLESTYQAMHMSFRAVLSVAENLSRLRGVFSQFLSSLALLRMVHWFYRKVLYMLGVVSENPLREEVWKAAEAKALGGRRSRHAAAPTSAWPVVTFFGLILGGPYLMFRLLSPPPPSKPEWEPSRDGGTPIVGMYDFETDVAGELSFRRGQHMLMEPTAAAGRRVPGWVLAARGSLRGMIPSNRVGLVVKTKVSPGETVVESPVSVTPLQPSTSAK